jgi:hypothetical protein
MPKFRLKSIVEDLKDVPEAYRSRYTERDDKFHLDEIEIDDGAELRSALEARDEQLKTATAELRKLKLDAPVRQAAIAAGVLDEDLEDVLTTTASRFDLDEQGRIVVKNSDGVATSLTPANFFEVHKAEKPKFYSAASPAEGKQIERAAFEKLPPAEQMAHVKQGNQIVDGQSAGSIGGGAAGKKTVPRSDFDKMPPPEQMAAVKSGAVIVD